MNILVINGSPKGKNSITLQTVLYIRKNYPKHTFEFLHVGQQIKALEKDFSRAEEALNRADLLLFSYPVYTFIAPSQLHRFFELVKASGIDLSGKAATQITTSKHFYDVTAHRYVQDNCQDLGIRFIKGLSADMEDLLKEKGRRDALRFWDYAMWCFRTESYMPAPVCPSLPALSPVTVPAESAEHSLQKEVVIVTDLKPEDDALKSMIDRFCAVFHGKTRIVNLRDYPFAGGCLGCFHCAVSGKCIYKDHFDEFLRNDIQKSAAILYAFTISDHSMGALFKQYDDRQFCNGHRTVTTGMPMGYLINGHYSTEFNLQMIIEGRAEVGGNFLAGVACNENDGNASIDLLSRTLTYALRRKYTQPQNFYGVGGMKIFRDLIYQMRGMMKADHKFYKEHGIYDFPQKKKGTILGMYLVGALISNPKIQKKLGNKMTEGMLAPYRKYTEEK